jgi:DNA-binding NtrC family response regulator
MMLDTRYWFLSNIQYPISNIQYPISISTSQFFIHGSVVLAVIQKGLYKILLVDDDLNCLDAIEQIMQRDGYETFPISEGSKAVEVITENNIDLAIVDFNMPDMDGIHVIKQIKRVKRDMPVILVTAQPSREVKIASIEAGAFSFISKPIDIPNFRQTVAEALQSPKLRNGELRRNIVFVKWIRWIINR